MSKGIFKVTVKSGSIQNLSQMFPDIVLGNPFIEIVFGEQIKRSKPTSNENNTLTWNESFSFQKTIEYTLSILLLQQSPNGQEILLGSQEIGINTFVRKLSTVDHPVELMNQGLAVCVALLNFEFFPSKGLPQQWLKTKIKQSDGQLHKLLISKMKATIESSETRPQYKNQCLRVQVGSKFWVTQPSRAPGFNLSWSESFTIVLENNEQEFSLEIVEEDGDFPVEQLGQAVLKLQQIKEGSSPNRIPIILEGSQIGYFYFQTEYQFPTKQAISPSQLQTKSVQYSSPPRNISGGSKKLGALILSTIKVFLEKNNSAEDAYLSVQFDGQTEKTSQFLGIANKLEWKERLVFTQPSHDSKLTFNLYDKHFAGDQQALGQAVLFLDQEYQNGGKFRSHKVDIFSEDRSIGQLFVNYEYVFDSIELSEYLKKRAMPSPSDIKKRELLQRRQQIMRPNSMINGGVSQMDFLPQVEGSANNSIFRASHNHSIMKSPQPTPAIKSVYSLSLPKLNYDIQVKEYNRLYTDSVFGKGMSNIHSAASLTHSIPSYSLPKAERFPSPSYHGFQSNTYKAPSLFGSDPNDPYVYSKKNIFTEDFRYKVVHRSPAQKSGVSFGIGSRFSSPSKQISPGYYQGPVLFEYNKQ